MVVGSDITIKKNILVLFISNLCYKSVNDKHIFKIPHFVVELQSKKVIFNNKRSSRTVGQTYINTGEVS